MHISVLIVSTKTRHWSSIHQRERTAAEREERWRTLKHSTVNPSPVGDTTRVALVLNGRGK
ncbi:hypothetical protein C5F59_006985 [Streptomyces sp. QL37]|uniref:hypothetical protein n=1 Tax=Streptomyces sp. QL37 TaxID=2093747 RepID=UPI000CF2F40A|nr:hypothetical protein [Streptomyces sp. QL37]PPQ56447.1 hypothetical protein C5F59_07060 [Streptomyces sp. QL37]